MKKEVASLMKNEELRKKSTPLGVDFQSVEKVTLRSGFFALDMV